MITWHPSPAVIEAELAQLDKSTDWESIDWTFDPVVVEVTAPPKRSSYLPAWVIGAICGLIFWVVEKDLVSVWWAWVLGR